MSLSYSFIVFIDSATTEIYTYGLTLALPDSLPISLDVQPELGRNSEYNIGIGRAVGLHECLMEGQVAALAVRSQGRLGSIDRVRAEDGELLVDDPQLRVRRLGLAHDRSNTPAVRPVVVEELDERDVTVGIATHGPAQIGRAS